MCCLVHLASPAAQADTVRAEGRTTCLEEGSSVTGDEGISIGGGDSVDDGASHEDAFRRDVLGSVLADEDVAIVPCAFAESGRFGAICPDAGVVVVVDSGVVLC
jgi:hypothetical protein